MLTHTGSVKRLKKSSKVLMTNLNPEGEKNFWKFYKNNFQTINEIILSQLNRIRSNLDPADQQDVLQDVLVALNRCDVLSSYDHRLVAFNTYFTNTVYGYIQHWFSKKRMPTWRPEPTAFPDNKSRYKRVYCGEFNGVHDNTHEEFLLELGVSTNIEDSYDLKERLTLLKKKLPPAMLNVYNYILNGYSNSEIASILNTTQANVCLKSSRIKSFGAKILAI
jgi:RNA polymerase sigma factor (sigma-70 family)